MLAVKAVASSPPDLRASVICTDPSCFLAQVRVELAFTDFYGSSQAQLALDDDNEPEGERIRTLRFGKDANPAMVAATAAATENRPPAAEPAARPSSNDNDDDADDDLSRRLKQALSATSEHER